MDRAERPAALKSGDGLMSKQTVAQKRWWAVELFRKLKQDEGGAALIEYTVLIGVMLVAVIVTILTVGAWVGNQWTALNGQLT